MKGWVGKPLMCMHTRFFRPPFYYHTHSYQGGNNTTLLALTAAVFDVSAAHREVNPSLLSLHAPCVHAPPYTTHPHTIAQRVLREDLYLPLLLAALLLLGAHAFATDARRMIISPLVRGGLPPTTPSHPSTPPHPRKHAPQQDRIIAMVQKLALDPLADPEGDRGSSNTTAAGAGAGLGKGKEGTGEPGGYGQYETTVIETSIGKITRACVFMLLGGRGGVCRVG